MLWKYALKDFAEKLNVLKVDDDVITPMENFSGTTTEITLKITTHGAVQFMSWIQGNKEIYMEYPSRNPAHMQGYIL